MGDIPSGTVTFLFTDIENSTRMWEEHGEGMRVAVEQHDAILGGAIEGHAGYVFSTGGDSYCAAFQRAHDAVAAAVDAQADLLASESTEPVVRVRMAIHSGEPSERDGNYYGPPLNRTARLLAVGHGGQILLSDIVSQLIAGSFPAVDLGVHHLSDIEEPEQIWQLVASELASEFPPLRTTRRRVAIPLSDIIGRDGDVANVADLIRSSRLVTLVGPGGAGKTRLAVEVMDSRDHHFPGGAHMVDLTPVSDSELVGRAVAGGVGIPEGSAGQLGMALARRVADAPIVVVLDNCEHVIEAAAALASELLAKVPSLIILATSREPLSISHEVVYPVSPLPVPPADPIDLDQLSVVPAVQLLVSRAAAGRPGFALNTDNAASIAQICRALDGLPLAIELAAARLRVLAPAQIAARLDERLALLAGGRRDAVDHHRSLKAAIEWSHDLLKEKEQSVFARLGVFVGSFTLEAVEAVADDGNVSNAEILDVLTALVDRSLVQSFDAGQTTRFRMLETLREFAVKRLADQLAGVRARHARFFCEMSSRLGLLIDERRVLDGTSTRDEALVAAQQLDDDLDNIRAGLRNLLATGQNDVVLEMMVALSPHWHRRRRNVEAAEWYRQAFDGLTDKTPIQTRADGLKWWAYFEPAIGISGPGVALQAADLYRELGDDVGLSHALRHAATAAADEWLAKPWQPNDQLVLLHEESLEAAHRSRDRLAIGYAEHWGGVLCLILGDWDTAVDRLESGTRIFDGVPAAEAMASAWLGVAYQRRGNLDQARLHAARALDLAEEAQDPGAVSTATRALADIEISSGKLTAAETALRRCEEANRIQMRDQGRGALLIQIAVDWAILLVVGRHPDAAASVSSALGQVRTDRTSIFWMRDTVRLLWAAAVLAERSGDASEPAHLIGAIESFISATRFSVAPVDQLDLETLTVTVRPQLSTHEYEQAVAAGRALDWDERIDRALVALGT